MLIFLKADVWSQEMFILPLSGSLLIVHISLFALPPVGEVSISAGVFFSFPVPYFPGEPTIKDCTNKQHFERGSSYFHCLAPMGSFLSKCLRTTVTHQEVTYFPILYRHLQWYWTCWTWRYSYYYLLCCLNILKSGHHYTSNISLTWKG